MAENQSFEEQEHCRLSFGDFSMPENSSGFTDQSPIRTPSTQPDTNFEFIVSQPGPAPRSHYKDVVFCGKIIHEVEEERQLNEYQKRDYFATLKSHSFPKPCFSVAAERRHSGDLGRPKCSAGDLDYHVQRVNITSLTSMSAKSRRRMFMFGPVKFRPEMELSAIKQRQAKRPEKTAAAQGGGGKSHWSLMKSSLRGRSHFTNMLARSLGCIPVARGGVERLVGAN